MHITEGLHCVQEGEEKLTTGWAACGNYCLLGKASFLKLY